MQSGPLEEEEGVERKTLVVFLKHDTKTRKKKEGGDGKKDGH